MNSGASHFIQLFYNQPSPFAKGDRGGFCATSLWRIHPRHYGELKSPLSPLFQRGERQSW